ncbi:hypothetical protein ACIOD2_13390 [Amycolatopsis sp. NPDC088138]|uniref:hypothetical protein n=1 Tax=Amycolatopsis sp. NPDC088138 TaxID=3363938 RepID=UPI00382F75FA
MDLVPAHPVLVAIPELLGSRPIPLLTDPARIAAMSARASATGTPDAGDVLARHVLTTVAERRAAHPVLVAIPDLLGSRPPIPLLTDPERIAAMSARASATGTPDAGDVLAQHVLTTVAERRGSP